MNTLIDESHVALSVLDQQQGVSRAEALLVSNLSVSYDTPDGPVYVLEGIELSVNAGECIGIVGESGSGKSVLARSILGIHPGGNPVNISGSIEADGTELTSLSARKRRDWMGARIAMVFQDPMTSLNPVVRVGEQIVESLTNRRRLSRAERRAEAVRLLTAVGVPDPDRRVDSFPNEFSGGMRQRVGIAAAIAGRPQLLLADEPTTALDVTVQRLVLDLLDGLRREHDMAMLIVTHDLSLLSGRADRVAVMYAGRIVECGPTSALIADPAHPYTRALLDSAPSMTGEVRRELPSIPGSLPSLSAPRVGCPFAARCPLATARCEQQRPPMETLSSGHQVACWAVGGQEASAVEEELV